MGNVRMSGKVVRSEGLGLKCEYSKCGEIYWKLYTVLCDCGVVYRLYRLCCEIIVCTIVSLLCVLL